MWIVPPSIRLNFAQASGCSEKDLQPDFDTWVSVAAACSTVSGKLSPVQSWKRAWQKEAWMQRLYGAAISEKHPSQSFAEWWTALFLDSRAPICQSPASVLGLMPREADSSLMSLMQQTLAVHDGFTWRTSQLSLLPPPPLWTRPKGHSTSALSPASWGSWPPAGGTRNGSLFPRPMWAPATGALDGFASHGAGTWLTPFGMAGQEAATGKLGGGGEFAKQATHWTTPKASDGEKGGPNQRGSKGDMPLPSQSAQWMTPSVSNASGNEYTRDRGHPGMERLTLPGQAIQHWPTPAASMTNDGESPETWKARAAKLAEKHGNGNGVGMPLTIAAKDWPTPASRDYRSPNLESLESRGGGKKGEQLPNFVAHHWPTPNAAVIDHKKTPPIIGNRRPSDPQISTADIAVHHFSHQVQATQHGETSSQPGPNFHRRLNPIFVSWLMGWPLTWLIAEPHASSAAATEWWHSQLQQRLSSFFGEQQE